MDREKLKETIQACLSGNVVNTWSFMPNLIKAIMELSEQDRQSLYELLVDEMPKRHGDYCVEYCGEGNCSQCEEYNAEYNHGVDDCLAVIKRVLIGGEK